MAFRLEIVLPVTFVAEADKLLGRTPDCLDGYHDVCKRVNHPDILRKDSVQLIFMTLLVVVMILVHILS